MRGSWGQLGGEGVEGFDGCCRVTVWRVTTHVETVGEGRRRDGRWRN